MIYWPNKTPVASLVFGANWAPTLANLGDPTIVESAWEVVSGSVVLSNDLISANGKTTSVRITGGTHKEEQILRNTILTSDGDTLDELCYLLVKDGG